MINEFAEVNTKNMYFRVSNSNFENHRDKNVQIEQEQNILVENYIKTSRTENQNKKRTIGLNEIKSENVFEQFFIFGIKEFKSEIYNSKMDSEQIFSFPENVQSISQ